jgi:hypothetical protein
MPHRFRGLALVAGFAFVALGVWQMATAPDATEPEPAAPVATAGD